jgi:hypothetical protein
MGNRLLTGIAVAAVTLIGVAQAQAAPIVFFGEGGTVGAGAAATARASFLAALSAGVSSEDFEGIANGTNTPFGVSFTGGLGTINAALGGTATVQNFSAAGRFATSGVNYVESRPGFNVDFGATLVAAFGFFATDIGDFSGQLSLDLLTGGGTTNVLVPHTVGSAGSTNGLLLFFGVIDTVDQFTRVTFNNTDTSDAFGFDDLTVGDVAQVMIPEASTLGLFGLGLVGLGLATRRRKSA